MVGILVSIMILNNIYDHDIYTFFMPTMTICVDLWVYLCIISHNKGFCFKAELLINRDHVRHFLF